MRTVDANLFTWSRKGSSGFFVGVAEASSLGIPPGDPLNSIAVCGRNETRVFIVNRRLGEDVIVLALPSGGGEIHILND